MGLGPRFVGGVESLYRRTSVRVRIGTALSEPFRYERGVRQGCPLSPLLFDIFIDDLLDGMAPVAVPGLMWGLSGICFADDKLILARDSADAQNKISRVEKWMEGNGMRINGSKCGAMAIGAQPTYIPVLYQGVEVPRVKKYVYLGLELNEDLDYVEMAKSRLKRGWDSLARMKNLLLNSEVSLKLKKWLIARMLAPRIQYGAALYAHSYAHLAGPAKVYNRALAMVAGKPNVCTRRILNELRLTSLHETAFYHKFKSISKWRSARVGAGELIATRATLRSM
ncbi:hypothetical protein PAPHI01_2511 [Pancytospora philotis]|nr:hypothetical protein PAPHI01_2511 [Pancytospora philotis]